MVKLRRLYGKIAVSRSDPLQGSDKYSVNLVLLTGVAIVDNPGQSKCSVNTYPLRMSKH